MGVIHLETQQSPSSTMGKQELSDYVLQWYASESQDAKFDMQKEVSVDRVLGKNIIGIRAVQQGDQSDASKNSVECHVYQLDETGPQNDFIEGDETIPSATHFLLPCKELDPVWDTLEYDSDVKEELLNFTKTALLFAKHGVCEDIIGINRVVLLHGPPGTGKTTLCKALAQKLSIRLSSTYGCGQLIEINSHSLFSKWFSESGKLVMQMFSKIRELIMEPNYFLCVLIDEVESLAHARNAGSTDAEPADSMRVVNALLTQIDSIRRFPNVLIMTTSNVTQAIDLAFVDRADIKKYIGLPSAEVLFKIFKGCVQELVKKKLIKREDVNSETEFVMTEVDCEYLMLIAKKSQGLSGRNARKLPFLGYAKHMETECPDLMTFLKALEKAVEDEFNDRKLMLNQ